MSMCCGTCLAEMYILAIRVCLCVCGRGMESD